MAGARPFPGCGCGAAIWLTVPFYLLAFGFGATFLLRFQEWVLVAGI
jgi:hypothetical protein